MPSIACTNITYNISSGVNKRDLLHYKSNDAKQILLKGQYVSGVSAKYWYTYFTDLPDNYLLTIDNLHQFNDDIFKGKIMPSIISNECWHSNHTINYLYNYVRQLRRDMDLDT